ncbi:hypothetical protein COY06_04190 [Candidatus Peregrinibacteria bacterium CG_4_10_14_0_2_um_filter_41_8]|nr:MAG: hypothetical protein COY06_04190 [Candidatus Peregrinibacteria bacterium CG_4_10_14_0_2_um_filter_41_8]
MNKSLMESTARNFFMYILMFIALYITAFSASGTLWQLINIAVEDPLQPYNSGVYAKDALKGFLSALIVAGPLFIFLALKLNKEAAKFKSIAKSAIRKWLTYITLLVAAIVVLITLITLVNGLLNGETTLRFFLHVADVLLVTGLVFGYYLWDLKKV